MPNHLWNQEKAAHLHGLDELVYRSHLLGSNRAIANWGGGNTSMKTTEKDFRGCEIFVMWVKGSGSDLRTMGKEKFTALNLEDIQPLLERDQMNDKEMVDYLSHCMIDRRHPRSSIETLLHAFLPFKHVDHTHPDAIISICCSDNGKEAAEEIYGDRFVWVPYVRPGFELSKLIAESVKKNPNAKLVLMEKHGLVTWGETSEESYNHTISAIQEAEDYVEKKARGETLFGGEHYKTLPEDERKEILSRILPVIRGEVSEDQSMIAIYDDSETILQFTNSVDAPQLSQIGAACPDHLVHTKRFPLYVDWDPISKDSDELTAVLKTEIARYKESYRRYFQRNQHEGDQLMEPVPRVVLIPGIGMVNTGKSHNAAKVSEALYHRAVAVMAGASILGEFVSLNEEESFGVEYWPLELYKLSLAPPEAEFSRQVAFVTGGAGGIGSASCRRFASEGSHVVVADLNLEGAENTAKEINDRFGNGRAIAVKVDVTSEEAVHASFQQAILTYGGVDIVVNNAGLATSSPLDETSIDEWELNMNVLGKGYFLVAREAFRLMKTQKLGGKMVFVGSKNSIYAGKNNTAYSSAKAAEVHLARCIAAEGGEYGIRVNSVLPDAVLKGSQIWDSQWREERAAAYGIHPDELEEHYRKRTTLMVNVLPEDIAEAIAFFASSKSAKTTGSMITVDGGVPAAFTR